MHDSFYASGILYNLKTHQILLLKSDRKDDQPSNWSILGGHSREGEDAQTAFARIMQESLNIKLKQKNIYSVYDYFHNALNKVNYVFYAEVGRPKISSNLKSDIPSWVSFKETLKLALNIQTKQDVVVSERVISSKARNRFEASKDTLTS